MSVGGCATSMAQPSSAASLQGLDSFVHSRHLCSINYVSGSGLSQGTHPCTRKAGPWPVELTFWSEETVCKRVDK